MWLKIALADPVVKETTIVLHSEATILSKNLIIGVVKGEYPLNGSFCISPHISRAKHFNVHILTPISPYPNKVLLTL